MIICGVLRDGPPWGNCDCGWPLLRDGTCSNGECPCPPIEDDEREEDEHLRRTCLQCRYAWNEAILNAKETAE